jgi:hypothetical protein
VQPFHDVVAVAAGEPLVDEVEPGWDDVGHRNSFRRDVVRPEVNMTG